MHIAHQEHAAREARQQTVEFTAVETGVLAGPFETIDQARLVAFGLQAAKPPGADVGQPLVVEVDRVLRRQHDADTGGASLLQQRQQRSLRGRVRARREIAEDLVHVDQRAQAGGATLRTHPAGHGVQQQRDEEHALRVVEMGDGEDGDARLAGRGAQERGDIERFTLRPHLEAWRRNERIDSHRQREALLRRVEALEVDDTDAGHRRLLDALDQHRQVRALARLPRRQ